MPGDLSATRVIEGIDEHNRVTRALAAAEAVDLIDFAQEAESREGTIFRDHCQLTDEVNELEAEAVARAIAAALVDDSI